MIIIERSGRVTIDTTWGENTTRKKVRKIHKCEGSESVKRLGGKD